MSASRRYPKRDDNHASLYDELIDTQTYFQTLRFEQSTLASQFNEWRDHRRSTIDTVDNLQKKIDTIFVGCNAAKGAGALAGVVGGIAWGVDAFMKFKGYNSAAKIIWTSRLCAGASAAAITSSTLLEFGLTRSSMNEIERVIKKDVELTNPLKEFIQCSHEAETLFYRMFQCNIFSTTFANIMKTFGYCFEVLDAGLVELDDLIRDLQLCKLSDMESSIFEVSQKVLKFLRKVQRNPRLLTPMKAICRIYEETPELFEFVKLATDIYWNGYEMIRSGPLSVVLSLSGAACECPDIGFGFSDYVLNAAAIASHVVTFILSVKNVQEGKSKYSESLGKLKLALNKELEEVTKKCSGRFRLGNTKHADILELRNLKLS